MHSPASTITDNRIDPLHHVVKTDGRPTGDFAPSVIPAITTIPNDENLATAIRSCRRYQWEIDCSSGVSGGEAPSYISIIGQMGFSLAMVQAVT